MKELKVYVIEEIWNCDIGNGTNTSERSNIYGIYFTKEIAIRDLINFLNVEYETKIDVKCSENELDDFLQKFYEENCWSGYGFTYAIKEYCVNNKTKFKGRGLI
jgi:hypothetical protein